MSSLKALKDEKYGFKVDFNNIPGLNIDGESLSLTYDVFKIDFQYIRALSTIRNDLYVMPLPTWMATIAETDLFVEEKIGIEKGMVLKVLPIGYTFSEIGGDFHRIRLSPFGIALFQFRNGEWEGGYYYLINGTTITYDGRKRLFGNHNIDINWALELSTMQQDSKPLIKSSAYVDLNIELYREAYLFINNRFQFFTNFREIEFENENRASFGMNFLTLVGLGRSF